MGKDISKVDPGCGFLILICIIAFVLFSITELKRDHEYRMKKLEIQEQTTTE